MKTIYLLILNFSLVCYLTNRAFVKFRNSSNVLDVNKYILLLEYRICQCDGLVLLSQVCRSKKF